MSEASAAAAGDSSKSSDTPASSGGGTIETHGYSAQTTRAVVLATAAACFALFWIVGGWLQIPEYRRFEVSLTQQPGAGCVLDFVVAAMLLAACTIAGHFIAGRRWLYAGPFVAAFGLMAWSCRGGPSRYVYQHAAIAGDGRSIFVLLALELAVLSLFVGAVWYFVVSRGQAMAKAPGVPETIRPRGDLPLMRFQAIGAQVVITALVIMILTPVDAKKGVIASVFLGSFIAASLTEYYFAEAELAAWYWVAPAVTGIIGYLLNCAANAAGVPDVTGHLMGIFAPLSRPLPLDYASAGMFAALLGFWSGGDHPEIAVGMDLFHAGQAGKKQSAGEPKIAASGA